MTGTRLILTCVAALTFSCGAAAQQKPLADATAEQWAAETAASTVQKDGKPQLQERNRRYELRPGDVIELVFSFTPEFNQAASIQPDGYVTLKGIGGVQVQGKTVPELTSMLKEAYGRFLQDPAIEVLVKDFEKPHFVVAGQVERPGKYELRADTTATEAIAVAGGFNGSAKHSQVLLFRRVSRDWVEVKKLNIKRLYGGDYREDVQLRAGDMLFVPKSTFSKIKPFLPTWGLGAYLNPF